MTIILNIIAGVLSGILGSMGIGGGGILIIYLTLYLSLPQLQAQGINLLFFIPCGIIAIIIHTHNKLIVWKEALPLIILGLIGVAIGSMVAKSISDDILRKVFALFLLVIGIYTLFSKDKSSET